MKTRVWLSALALSAGFSTVSMAQVSGTVKLDGKAPEAAKIDMSSAAQCASRLLPKNCNWQKSRLSLPCC